MQYRGIEIKIVRMGAPGGGWKWTLTIDGKESSRIRPDREEAVDLAKRFIDDRLGRRKPRFGSLGPDS
jgi:hypothetical protein